MSLHTVTVTLTVEAEFVSEAFDIVAEFIEYGLEVSNDDELIHNEFLVEVHEYATAN